MPDSSKTKSIRVPIMGREYALRVQEEDEEHTRQLAARVNKRMKAFKDAHPEQAELTTAVITALALAEELDLAREDHDKDIDAVAKEATALSERLAGVLNDAEGRGAEGRGADGRDGDGGGVGNGP